MTGAPCFFRAGAAPAAYGHRAYIGLPRIHAAPARHAPRGHRAYTGAPPAPVAHNNMAAMVAAVMAERRRRALYAADERAPEFGPHHRNFFAPDGAPAESQQS